MDRLQVHKKSTQHLHLSSTVEQEVTPYLALLCFLTASPVEQEKDVLYKTDDGAKIRKGKGETKKTVNHGKFLRVKIL